MDHELADQTLEKVVAKAERVLERNLTNIEKALIEYAVKQVTLGLVDVE
jgi:hypothetical protein